MTEPSQTGTIVVSGTGRVAVEPDVAELRLGVAISRETVAEARSEAAATMSAILAAIREAGVAERDIRTAMLSVQPRYDYRDGQAPALAGYDLSNVVEVTVRELAAVGDVIDGSLRAGATSLDGLAFQVADPSAAEAPRGPRRSPTRGRRPRCSRLPPGPDRRRRRHRRGRRAAVVPAREGRPDVARRRQRHPGRRRDHGRRGHRHGHVPDRRRLSVSRPAAPPGAARRCPGSVA